MAELTEKEVKKMFDGFKQILRQGKTFSAVTLDAMIERTSGLSADYDFLNKLCGAAKNIDSIPDYLFAKYKDAENQPEDEREGWSLQEIYSSVEKELNELMRESGNASDRRKRINKNDGEIWKLIVWSAELWFLRNLQKCEHDSVKRFIESNAEDLFHEFFDPIADKNETRFEVLAENDCVDIMKKLLRPELGVSSFLQKYFDEKGNVKEFCQTPMSQNMIKIINPHSKKFYIIPRPSDRNNFAKMYGIIVRGFFKSDQVDYFEAEQQAGTTIEAAFKIANINIVDSKDHPCIFESEDFSTKLCEWVEDELKVIKNDCSLLILTVFCHGIHGHLSHKVKGEWRRLKIEDLFKSFKKFDGLEGIPKVIAIEACQYCKEGFEVTDLQEMIIPYNNAMLLMSCDKGKEATPFQTTGFLINLAEELKNSGFSKSVAEMFTTVRTKYIKEQEEELLSKVEYTEKDLTVQPVMHRSKVSKEILIPKSTNNPDDSDEQDSQ